MDFDVDSPEDFQDKNLRSLDELVRCPICCEIMVTATTVIKCQHNFCSMCIRRHVENKKQCPICKEECVENSLVTNRLVNQISVNYKVVRNNILVLDKQIHAPETRETPAVSESTNTPNNTSYKADASEHKTNSAPQTLNKSSSGPSSVRVAGAAINSPQNQTSLSSMFRIKKRGFGGEVKTVGEASSCQSSTVQKIPNPIAGTSANLDSLCPVCGCSVPGRKINSHLDMCLKRQNREQQESKRPAKKKLPNQVWNIMNEKKLRAECKKHGLNSAGKKPDLIKRLKEFTLRYNSQIDQLKQKSDQELAREVDNAERIQQKTPPTIVGKLKTDEDRAAYSSKYEDQFVKLINSARQREKKPNIRQTRNVEVEEPRSQDTDEIKIIHEVQSTPKKKCNGSLREFFKSPNTSSPLKVSPPTFSKLSRTTVHESQEIQDFPSSSSEVHSVVMPSPSGASSGQTATNRDTSVLSPLQLLTPSPVAAGTPTKNFKSAAKSLFSSQSDSAPNGSSDLFGEENDSDFDEIESDDKLDEMIRSFTQVPKDQDTDTSKNHNLPESSPNRLSDLTLSPSTMTRVPLSPSISRRNKTKANSPKQNIILDRVLKAEENVYIEQEVSRLYAFQDENTNSVNTSVSKLDRLLERSYKNNRTPKRNEEPALNDSMADLLDGLSKSPAPNGTPCFRADDGITTIDTMESPPRQIPDIEEDDLPAFNCHSGDELNSEDEMPEISPVITTGIRVRKRTSGSVSPFSETPPKRGRIL